jgi:terminase large subunit-like protein
MSTAQPSLEEAVALGAVDDDFFGSFFFPEVFRQEHPPFARKVQFAFDDPTSRYVSLKMFRGSAKTTRARVRIAKHISYAISRTILLVSNAQKHSIYSLKWLKRQVEYNTRWAKAFGLEKGATWSDEIIEIKHNTAQCICYVIPLGITGQIRGINLDSFRPDFILLDDPDNEETTATVEQREKTQSLIFGSLKQSLAPPTEAPLAKLAVLQTPLDKEDTIALCDRDPNFRSVTVSCFDESGQSSWPARFPTAFLLNEKEMHIRMNKLSLWLREMECKITSPEAACFQHGWLRFWDEVPDEIDIVIPIDPASSEAKDADDQVIGALGFGKGKLRGNVYLLEYSANKGEMPDAAAAYVFHLMEKYKQKVRKIAVESVAYQRVLAWYIEKHMAESRRWKVVDRIEDKRKKSDRIIQELVDIAANGRLFVHRTHTKFIQQFTEYSPRIRMHDDVLDMVAIGVASYKGGSTYDADYTQIAEDEKSIPDLGDWRTAP